MRTTTAFFAGAGTIAVALAAGLGGGLLISSIVSPHAPKQGAELSKVERRATDPIPASNAASESSPYIEATQAAATKPVTVSPAPQAPSQETQQQQAQPQQAQPPQPQPQTQQANATPAPVPQAAAQPADRQPARNANSTAPVSNPQPAATSTQAVAREPSATPDNAFARARDVDVKRELRRAEEKRKAERRLQWVEKRRYRGRGDDELRDVEQKVREETDSPRIFAAEPVRNETPRIRLFGDDD
jgi:outer membrane biosynthesis protein TonB